MSSTKIFGFVGVDEDILATLAVGAVNVAMTIVSVFLIDRLGRKTLLLGGVVLMVVSLTALCFVLLMLNDSPGAQGNIAVAGVLVFVIGFAVGMGATSWVIIAEVLPSRIRSQAMSVAVAVNWACNLVITQFSLSTIEALGGGSSDDQQKRGVGYLFGIFAGISLALLVFIVTLVPETKGVSLSSSGVAEEDKELLADEDEEQPSEDWS